MMTRWWWMALGAVGALAVQAWSAQEPTHWIERNGTDWGRMGHEAQTAYVEGFLAGAALGQAAERACTAEELRAQRQGCEWTGDSAGLTRAIGERRRSGGFRFPYGANVYASRISDYYWWHNHRPLPIWYAFWEVNAILTRPN
jgi:hypothetical protein